MAYDILVAQSKFAAAFALVEKARKDEIKDLPTFWRSSRRALLHLLGDKAKALAALEKYVEEDRAGRRRSPWFIDLVEAELAVGRRDAAFAAAAKILAASADNRRPERKSSRSSSASAARTTPTGSGCSCGESTRRRTTRRSSPGCGPLFEAKATAKEIDALFADGRGGQAPRRRRKTGRRSGAFSATSPLAHKQQEKATRAYKESQAPSAPPIRLGDLLAEQKQWRRGRRRLPGGLPTRAEDAGRRRSHRADRGRGRVAAGAGAVPVRPRPHPGRGREGGQGARIDKAHLLPLGETRTMRYSLSRALEHRKHRDAARREQDLLRRARGAGPDRSGVVLHRGGDADRGDRRDDSQEVARGVRRVRAVVPARPPAEHELQPRPGLRLGARVHLLPAGAGAGRRGPLRRRQGSSSPAAQSCVPGQVELAIHVVPDLDARGRKADADALYRVVARPLRGVC